MPIKSNSQYAMIDVSTLGDNTIVAAVTGKKIRVLAVVLVANGGANTIRFESAAGGTPLTGHMILGSLGHATQRGAGW